MDSSTDGPATSRAEVDLWPIPLAEAAASVGGTLALVRTLLRRYVPELEDAAFATGPTGKPYLAGSDWSYNLSHAGDWLVLALCRGRDIGVDIEPVGELADVDLLAATYCSPTERLELDALSGIAKARAFLQQWVRKEAVGKAHGSGFVDDPASVPASQGSLVFAERPWNVVDFTPSEGYVGAIALAGAASYRVRVHPWPPISQGA